MSICKKDIPMKTALSEDDINQSFNRFTRMYGCTDAQLLRRAWFFFEDNHWDELSRYEDRRDRAGIGPLRAGAA